MKNPLSIFSLAAVFAALFTVTASAGAVSAPAAHSNTTKSKQPANASVAFSGHTYAPGFVYHGGYYGAHKR
jgi:hypothetical protein